ncbi:MAG: hypothetical protein C4331_06815 [Meiothermus sp.]
MLSWLDLIALLVFATAIALGIRQGVPFVLAVVPALVLYVLLAPLFPAMVLPVLALALGIGMASLTHYIPLPRLSPPLEAVLGGVGGFLWGTFLALTIWVSFPSEYVASSGIQRYPSEQLQVTIRDGIINSPFARPLFSWASESPILKAALLPHEK